MTINTFLTGAMELFTDTLDLILSQPVLAFFAAVPLVLAVLALLGAIVRGVKKR